MVAVSALIVALLARMSGAPEVLGVDGKLHRPLIEAAGKPVAFIFISHDCPVCNTYAPEFGRLASRFAGRARIDLIYCDQKLTIPQAREHAREFSLDKLTLLLDPSCAFASACHAAVTPQAVVFDSHGNRAYSGRIDNWYVSLGHQKLAPTTHELADALDAVLAHKLPTHSSEPPVGCIIVFPRPLTPTEPPSPAPDRSSSSASLPCPFMGRPIPRSIPRPLQRLQRTSRRSCTRSARPATTPARSLRSR